MKLHPSIIEKLLNIYTNYGGFSNERKLKEQLANLDFTVYERKSTANQELILVLTEDYVKKLGPNKG
jgi:hypothetical protein